MGIGILHLSDIHLKGTEHDVAEWASAIKASVHARCATLSTVLVIVSGDVAFSGKAQQYERAAELFEALVLELQSMDHVTVLGPVIVPGNHDCNFEDEGDARPDLLATLAKKLEGLDLKGQTVEQIAKVQDEFFEFERRYSEAQRKNGARLYYTFDLQSPDGPILVHCFNTAWVSRQKELQGQLLFPEHIELSPANTLPSLAISVFHHPYAWIESTNHRKFRRLIESASDIVLTGHEHDGDAYSRDSSSGEHVQYVEGAALQSSEAPPGFHFVTIDTQRKQYEVLPFERKGQIFEPLLPLSAPFIRNPRLLAEYFENNAAFRKEFNELGGTFSHPVKEDLEINDLFVYPDLRARNPLEKQDKLISSQNVREFVVNQRYLNISGGILSGKTTLGRKLYLDLQGHSSYVPIWLSGDEFRGDAKGTLARVVDRAFSRQYAKERLEHFRQLDPKRKALIIDDWHLAKFNSKTKADLLARAKVDFDVVVTLDTDGSWIQDLLEAGTVQQIADFHRCDIKEFGYRLRSQLISKWHRLGREFDLEDSELIHAISTSEHLLDSVIGKGIVPSDPVFILYVLQITEPNSQSTVTHGSYGHVYEALLTARLARVSSKTSDLGTKYTYLSLIAYRLFQKQRRHLDLSEIREVHQQFQREYDIVQDCDQMIRNLEEAGILGRTGDDVRFLHKYCYYYFVAKYLQKALANADEAGSITQLLFDMADMVHDEEYMNILIFYIYLTEDRRLIEHIISNARLIYGEYQPCDLERDVAFIGDLWKPRPVQLSASKIEDNREQYQSRRDEDAEAATDELVAPKRTKYDASLRDALKIDFAFGYLQVMGQVLRNFPGDLKADLKFQLADESYRPGLRTLKAFLLGIENAVEEIRSRIEKSLASLRAKPDEAYRRAGQMVALFAEAAIYGLIKKVSISVGLEDLRETYAAVRKAAGPLHIPTRLIDLSIHLDHFPKLPMADIEELAEIPPTQVVPYTILRLLVADRLYLFPIRQSERQKLAALLDIDDRKFLLGDKKLKSK